MTESPWPPADLVDLGPRASGAGTLDKATRERLLDATDQLVQQFGMSKTSMADVARGAGVARGTLYRYFESREVLFNAMAQRTTERFFDEVSAAMDRRPTLAEQLGAFCEMMIRAIHPANGGLSGNPAALIRRLATQSAQALRRTARFLQPYIESARARGEVREDLDVADASEWLARILLSFTIFQASISYNAEDALSVSNFVQRYAITGLAGE